MPKARRTLAVALGGLTGALLATGGCGQLLGLGNLTSSDAGDSSRDAGVDAYRAALDGGSDARRDGARADAATEAGHREAGSRDAGSRDASDAASSDCVPIDAAVFACGAGARTTLRVGGDAGTGGDWFATVTEALAQVMMLDASTVTIEVAPGTYTEADLVVPGNVTLAGAGPDASTLAGPETCSADASTCPVVTLEPGGVLCGFTLTTPPTGKGAGAVGLAGGPAPRITNVAVAYTPHTGITAAGSMTVGPGVTSEYSGENGLVAESGTLQVVTACGVTNHFDNNFAAGLAIYASATLTFQGGTANGNRDGILFVNGPFAGQVLASATNHVAYLVANDNAYGIIAYATSLPSSSLSPLKLELRSSDLSQNTSEGLYYDYGSFVAGAPPLDIGTPGSPGGNVFWRPDAAPSSGAGLFLCRPPDSLAATGDTFSSCTPSSASLSNCTTVPTQYVDEAYVPSRDGGPPITTCH